MFPGIRGQISSMPPVDKSLSISSLGWISVKERMPEAGVWVLIEGRFGYRIARWWIDPGLDEGNVFKERWVPDAGGGIDEKYVTHWMPLPEPPNK